MNLERLRLRDFGTYAGEQVVELGLEPDRPVVLVGGTNGAGKTTLLEAMLLCLHGRRALWDAISLRAYHEYVDSRLHRPPSDDGEPPAKSAEVELTFTQSEAGTESQFVVRRAWRRSAAGAITEHLTIHRDGLLLEDHTGDMAQSFLDGILPPALAGLFFFDGEKIQNLADDDTGRELRDAVRRLLGLDLLERLRQDLVRYASKVPGGGRGDAPQRRLAQAREAFDEAVVALDACLSREQELQASKQEIETALARLRARFEAEGGAIAEARTRLERRQQQARQRADRADQSLRELIVGLLPMALCPELTQAVIARLEHEDRLEQDEMVRRRVLERAEQLAARLGHDPQDEATTAAVLEVLAGPEADHRRVHDLSPMERLRVMDNMRVAREQVPGAAAELARALRRSRTQVAALQDALDRAPDPSDVAPLVEAMQEVGRSLGAVEQELREVERERSSLQHAHDNAEREVVRARDEVLMVADASDRSAAALRTVGALEEFEAATATAKLQAVEEHTARFFNRLSRKRELLSGVSIDPDTFALRLRRWDGGLLPKERLSAGERQLLAIALLWALRTVSGRPLPVVIDTPLARLDVEHRHRLLSDYLPNASHQVIVLATDSEVDGAAAAELESSVSHRYRLVHDVQTFSTRVEAGWFEERLARAR